MTENMNNKKSNSREWMRVHEDFAKSLNMVKLKRLEMGKDDITKPTGFKRLTLALTRTPKWPDIVDLIAKADLPPEKKMDKRGNIRALFGAGFALIIVAIIAFIIVLLSAAWNNSFSIITNGLTSVPSPNNYTNISQFSQITFGNLNTSFQQFRWWTVILIFIMFIGIFISFFLVKAHPAWFAFYIILAIAVVAFSIPLSRSYEAVYTSGGTLGSTLQSFTGASWLILYLPAVLTVVAFVGAIFLFVAMNRDPEQGDIL